MTDRVLDLVAAHDERELATLLIRAEDELARLRKIEEAARYLMELYDDPMGKYLDHLARLSLADALAVSAGPKASSAREGEE